MLSKNSVIINPRSTGWPRAIVLMLVASLFVGSLLVSAQQKPEPQGAGGVSTGTPLNYATKRTVGITDPKAPAIFEDLTDKTALASYRHRSGTPEKN